MNLSWFSHLLCIPFVLQGCLCVYGSVESLHYIQEYLDSQAKSKFDSIDSNNTIQCPPPTVLVLARNPNNEDDIHFLRKEGHKLAHRYCVEFPAPQEWTQDCGTGLADAKLIPFRVHSFETIPSIRILV